MFWELHWPVKTLHMRPSGPNTVQCNHYISCITTPFGSWYLSCSFGNDCWQLCDKIMRMWFPHGRSKFVSLDFQWVNQAKHANRSIVPHNVQDNLFGRLFWHDLNLKINVLYLFGLFMFLHVALCETRSSTRTIILLWVSSHTQFSSEMVKKENGKKKRNEKEMWSTFNWMKF